MVCSTLAKLEVAQRLQVHFQIAKTNYDVSQCRSLIAEVYYKKMGITFADDTFDIENKIELYPHHYLMGLVQGELVACIGLYLHSTNPERYGKVTDIEVDMLLKKAGVCRKYSGKYKRELTKFVVKEEWRNKGIGKRLLAAAHSKDFIHMNEEKPHVLINCATLSMFKHFWQPLGIGNRPIKPVPIYKIHEFYRHHQIMESRLTIPSLDIPARWYHFQIPGHDKIRVGTSQLLPG
jgi:GNAT superfamily N-acetyltransferase